MWPLVKGFHEGKKQYKRAAESFEKAVTTTKKKALKGNYYYRLGKAYVLGKEYKKAETALKQALNITRKESIKAACNFYLGEVYKYLSQKRKAIQYYKKAAKNRSWKAPAEYEIDILENPEKYSY